MNTAWLERLQHRQASKLGHLWDLLDQVKDPEVPVLSLWDLGVLRDIQEDEQGRVTVWITPTYSGCPALDAMRTDIAQVLQEAGVQTFQIRTRLAPAWSTDELSPQGREQLRQYGIAPPSGACAWAKAACPSTGVQCPHCGSGNTQCISEFGSTACKALFQCLACQEPFDYFKHL